LEHTAALTLVSAPAGFGKSTLLTEWRSSPAVNGSATAWLSLDERDNDPAAFLRYVVAAVKKATPGVGDTTLSLLESGGVPVDAVLAPLLNELIELDREVVVVLDDYHVIDAPEIHAAVAFLVDNLPAHVQLVISSRTDPPLALARLRGRGELVEIRASDLRFTADEAGAYFAESMGVELDATDVRALEARTEGWIAALQLAALSMQNRDDITDFIRNFTGDDRFVVDYLAEEVLERQPDDVRHFLLQTSVLTRMTGPLCDAVTDGKGGAAMLETLERANLFLVPLDDRRQWYRYHHLFGDVLRARLLSDAPEQVSELHRRASAWHEEHGDRPEAISHALVAGDFPWAARLIELAAPAMRYTRQEVTLRRWLEALPSEEFASRPVLILTLVGARMGTGDTTGVEPLLEQAERWLDREQPPDTIVFDEDEFARLPEQIAVYRSGFALLAGDIAGARAHANEVLELAHPSDHYRRGGAAALLGLAHWHEGDIGPARERYAEAVGHFLEMGWVPDALGCSLALGDIQVAQGRFGDARRTFEAGLGHARGRPGLRGTADMHVALSELLLEANQLDDAQAHLDTATALGEHAGLPQNAYRRQVAAALLRQARGDIAGALELLEEAEAVFNTDFSPPIRPIGALRARALLAKGDVAGAARWAHDRALTPDDDLTYVQEFEHITLARVLLAQDATDRAVELLERLLAAARAGGREHRVVEVLVLLSRAHHRRGDPTAATSALDEALVRAQPEGYVRVFLDEGRPVQELVRTSHGSGPAADLSRRELEVLRLLRSELSGPEIARELVVSLNTMRTHTKSIYTKLGARNRREALRRAAELGL
jgi:LuxR family maltose regulon positive regulatory protein